MTPHSGEVFIFGSIPHTVYENNYSLEMNHKFLDFPAECRVNFGTLITNSNFSSKLILDGLTF